MYNIGTISRKFGISRTTLLYYEKKKLVVPARRFPSNYRTYSIADCEKLALIRTYRNVGLSLDEISRLLRPLASDERLEILKTQYATLTDQISDLKSQKKAISELLGNKDLVHSLSKENWVDLLSSIGLGPEERENWHRIFEEKMPDAHQSFLESLNIGTMEIDTIRQQSKSGKEHILQLASND